MLTRSVKVQPGRDRLLTKHEVRVMFGGIANSTLYALVARRRFPAPIKISANRVGWSEREIHEHLDKLRDERDAQRRTEVA